MSSRRVAEPRTFEGRKPRVPLEPLLAELGPQVTTCAARITHATQWMTHERQMVHEPIELLAELAGTTRRTIHRWKHQGIPVDVADRVACRLGVPAVLLWPDVWHLTDEELAS